MTRIEMTETRLEDLEQEMINASDNYARIKELNEEKEQLEATYEADITRWSELEEIKNNKECNHARDFIALFWL